MAYEVNDSSVTLALDHDSSYDDDEWDPFEYDEKLQKLKLIHNAISIVCAFAVFIGIFTNTLAFVVLVRGCLWLKHEGYVYLAVNFCVNVGILVFCTSSFWITSSYSFKYYFPPNTSTFMCKVWYFLMSIFFASGWLSVALLFNVYLREHLMHRRRCGCLMFAAKYCTLFASKVIVGVIFGVLSVLGIPYLAIFKFYYVDMDYMYIRGCHPSRGGTLDVALLVEAIVMWALPFFLFLPIILLTTLCTNREGNTVGFSQIEERSASDKQMRVVAVTLSSLTLFSQFVLVFLHRFPMSLNFLFTKPMRLAIEMVTIFALSLGLQPILCFVILKGL